MLIATAMQRSPASGRVCYNPRGFSAAGVSSVTAVVSPKTTPRHFRCQGVAIFLLSACDRNPLAARLGLLAKSRSSLNMGSKGARRPAPVRKAHIQAEMTFGES